MSKFHSTVSRRTFMKGLGLAGAGLGAAAAAAPVFRDLDEVMASPKAAYKLPWYIKEREFNNPTVEMDWNVFQSYDKRGSYSHTSEEKAAYMKGTAKITEQAILNKRPGSTLKDQALYAAFRYSGVSNPMWIAEPNMRGAFVDGKQASRLKLGVPKWEGTPEENLRMCTAAIHFMGGRDIRAVAVDDKSRKVFYKYDGKGKPYTFADVDEPYKDSNNAAVIPNKCKWVLVYALPQSGISRFQHDAIGKVGVHAAYASGRILRNRIQRFIRCLGYQAIPTDIGSNSGFGVLSGVGELGRTDYVVSQTFGALLRKADFVITDLPLGPTKPIDAGIWRFCYTCGKCSETCPAGAIPADKEPTWEVSGTWNGAGKKVFPINYSKCLPWRGSSSYGGILETGVAGCNYCQVSCPFSRLDDSSIHDVIRGIIGTTSLLDGFFFNMAKVMDYGSPFITPTGEVLANPEEVFWNRNVDTFPYKGYILGV